MISMQQGNVYTDFGFAILRAPLLPFYAIDGKKRNLFLDRKSDISRLLELCDTPFFCEALFISSRELYAEFRKIRDEGLNPGNRGAALKVVSYFLRMSSRPTPFGLSAGVAAVKLTGKTSIAPLGPAGNTKKVCINFDIINKSLAELKQNHEFLKRLSFFSANAVYKNEKGLHFSRINTIPHGRSTIPVSPLIEDVLSFCTKAVPWSEITRFVIDRFQCTGELAGKFLLKMVDMELLLPDCYPGLFSKGKDGLKEVCDAGTEPGHYISRLKELAVSYEQAGIGTGLPLLEAFFQEQESIGDELHVLAGLGLSADSLNRHITAELSKVLHFLIRLRGVRGGGTLKRFTGEFERRYGDRAVSLCEALDERTGIGYPFLARPYVSSPLTNELLACDFEEFEQDKVWDAFLMSLLSRVEESGAGAEIELTEEDLQRVNSGLKEEALPESLYSIFSILAADQKQLDEGNFLVDFAFAGGPSCASAINRFAGLNSEIDKCLGACMEWENDYHEQRDRCLAELNFLPRQGIGGNILLRGHGRKYEIPILTTPTPGKDHFDVNQIMLQVTGGRMKATDKLTGREILPVATVLYDNHNTASASYNSFLTDLGHIDKIYNLEWSWGGLEAWMDHFPRIRFGKTILSREKWVVRLTELGSDTARWMEELKRVIRLRNIPVTVYYAEKTDNLLFLHLENEVCLELLVQKLKKYGKAVFTETLQNKDNTWLLNESGAYVHEFVMPVRLTDQMIVRKEHPQPEQTMTHVPAIAIGCNVLIMEELLVSLFAEFDERPGLGKLIHYYKNASPSELLLEVENPASELIGVIQKHFASYLEYDHIYYVRWQTVASCPAALPEEKFGQMSLAKAMLGFWKRRGLSNNYEARLTAYLTVAVQLFEKVFSDKKAGFSAVDRLLCTCQHLALQKGVHVGKTALAACYRNIIAEVVNRYTDELLPVINLLTENPDFFTMTSRPDDPAISFAALLELTGNKFLFCSPAIREQIIVLDFIKQYYKNRKFLLQYKGIDLLPVALAATQPA